MKPVPRVTVKCAHCGTGFLVRQRTLDRGHGKFCSNICGRKARAMPIGVRFWRHVVKTADCWNWIGAKNKQGYGHFTIRARPGLTCEHTSAHRFVWSLERGEIPPGLCVLHRCDNPSCVRPDHLFLGTVNDNNQDAKVKSRHYQLRSFCRRGHPMVEGNIGRHCGQRRCLACHRIQEADRQRRRKAA